MLDDTLIRITLQVLEDKFNRSNDTSERRKIVAEILKLAELGKMIAPDIELRALLLPESEPLMARPETHISACPDGPAYPRATPRPGRFFLIFSRNIAAHWGARLRP
ncbi:hypothetical protein [Bradyrhizobium elkanii]|uniref:hypothetical protein n=1 Tax=Bradyrhizobium elkanii TaxID=29448 RepID=UPI001FD87341|nr:hypothetical protein [Bradyrhizobium elkanii]